MHKKINFSTFKAQQSIVSMTCKGNNTFSHVCILLENYQLEVILTTLIFRNIAYFNN